MATEIEYVDFELHVSRRPDGGYEVRARSANGELSSEMSIPYASAERLQAQLEIVKSAVMPVRSRRIEDTTQRGVRQLGVTLFKSLMPHEIASSFWVTKREARRAAKGMRLKLRLEAPELASLPWEFLYDPQDDSYLAHSARNAIVRYIDAPQPVEPLTVEPPLRILGMVSSPDDLAPLEVEWEKQRIERALATQIADGAVHLHWLEGQTWERIEEQAWAKEPWHIFHFIGHGRYDRATDEGQIVLAKDNGRAHFLSASDLGLLLADFPSLRLVVLNACEGATGGSEDILSSAASILIRRGMPAVVAMQYEITDEAAIEFARKFYGSIAAERPVETAVAQARTAIRMSATGHSFEWATPVLYTHASEGLLFRLSGRDGRREEATSSGAGARGVPEQKQRQHVDPAADEEPVVAVAAAEEAAVAEDETATEQAAATDDEPSPPEIEERGHEALEPEKPALVIPASGELSQDWAVPESAGAEREADPGPLEDGRSEETGPAVDEPPGVEVTTWSLTVDNVGGSELSDVSATSAHDQQLADPFTLRPGEQRTLHWTEGAEGELGGLITVTAVDGGGAVVTKHVSTDSSVPVPEFTLGVERYQAPQDQEVKWWLTVENSGSSELTEVTATAADGRRLGEPFTLPVGRHKTISWAETDQDQGGQRITVSAVPTDGPQISSQLSCDVSIGVPALTVSLRQHKAAQRDLVGTKWQFDGTESTVRFLADGKASFHFAQGDPSEGSWKLLGSWLEFDANGYTNYEVTVEGDRMTGIWRRLQGSDKGTKSVTSLTEIRAGGGT